MNTTELQFFEGTRVSTRVEKHTNELLSQTLEAIFPTNAEEQKLVSARVILELSANAYSDEKLATLLADFEFMANTWLDDFERKQFNGKTLAELLKK